MKRIVKLGEVCEKIISGGTPKTDRKDFWNGSIPWITSADIQGNAEISPKKFITPEAVSASATNVLPKGNVIVVTRVGLGKVAKTTEDLAFSQDSQGLILKSTVDAGYLVHCLSKKVQRFKEVARGATIKGVTRDDLISIQIPLPELAEQQRIAALLNHADRLRHLDRQLLARYDDLAQSLFLDLFGDPVGNEKGWEMRKLDDLCKKITVGFVGTCEKFYTDSSGIPLLRTGNLSEDGLVMKNLKYVTKEFHMKNQKSKVTPGDILIARHGDNGKGCLVGSEITEANTLNVVILRPNHKLSEPRFILFTLNSQAMRAVVAGKTGGATQKVINTKAIQALRFPVPPLPLQHRFADLLAEIEKQKALARQQAAQSEALFQSLLSRSFD